MKASLRENFLVKENLNDNMFYDSLIDELTKILDEELAKEYEEINAELIDDCCLAIEALQGAINGVLRKSEALTSAESIIKKYNLPKIKRNIMVASCAAALFLVVAAVFSNTSGEINEESILKSALGRVEMLFDAKKPPVTEVAETTTKPPETTTTESETTTEIEADSVVTQSPTEKHSNQSAKKLKNIFALIPKEFNTIVSSVDEVDLSAINIQLEYDDATQKIIPVSECEIVIGDSASTGETEIAISYEGFTISIYITVLPLQQEKASLTSIYGAFNEAYTVADMQVVAVFSDGSEAPVDKSECEITKEFIGDTNECIVTVSYIDCSFQFISEGEVKE